MKIKIECQHNPPAVTAGAYRMAHYRPPTKCTSLAYGVLSAQSNELRMQLYAMGGGIGNRGGYNKKEFNKFLTEHLGLTPKAFNKVWNACMWQTFLKPLEEDHPFLFKNLLFTMKGLNDANVNQAWQNIKTITQYEKDGLWHLLPIAYRFGISTQEAKERLGKGAWKGICRNTFSRNKMLCVTVRDFEDLKWANNLNSTFIRKLDWPHFSEQQAPELLWANKTARTLRCLGNRGRISAFIDLFRDTKRMMRVGVTLPARAEAINILMRFSAEQMQREHDRLVVDINQNNTWRT